MQTGLRGAQRPSPRNITGMTFYNQQREQAAKKKAEDVDWYKVGFEAGFDTGFDAGVAAILTQLQDAGIIDSGDEDQEA